MIGENIQFLRKKRNWSQEVLAEKIGVSRQTIAKWEAGESTPDLEMGDKLSAALDVSLDELAHAPITEGAAGAEGIPRGRHLFGPVTVGDKGQIVIPIRARRIFHINPGDQLMLLGDENQGLALVNPQFFLAFAEAMRHGKD